MGQLILRTASTAVKSDFILRCLKIVQASISEDLGQNTLASQSKIYTRGN